jgi:ribosome modulation factor
MLVAYERGQAAARMGHSSATCPYPQEPKLTWMKVYRSYWQRGWGDAKRELVAERRA